MRRLLVLLFLFVLGGGVTGCDYLFWDPTDPNNQPPPEPDDEEEEPLPPPAFDGTTLTVANWNLEWFGDPENGPHDEVTQQANAAKVMADYPADLWAVQEVAAAGAFDTLVGELPGFAGKLSSDPSVSGFEHYTSQYDVSVGVLYRTDVLSLLGARVILGSYAHDFAGRPPLELRFKVNTAAGPRDLTVIVLHLKAEANCSGTECWSRRQAAADALKSYLDAAWPTQDVLVLGDWNDDVDTSIVTGQDTPFRALVTDAAKYRFVTDVLSARNEGTTVRYASTIDHQLATNELAAKLVAGSTTVITPSVPSYGTSTSDHYPVQSRFTLGQ